jgi:hypothetical protein
VGQRATHTEGKRCKSIRRLRRHGTIGFSAKTAVDYPLREGIGHLGSKICNPPGSQGLSCLLSLFRLSASLPCCVTRTKTANTTTSTVITIRGWAVMSTLSGGSYLEPQREGAIVSITPDYSLV